MNATSIFVQTLSTPSAAGVVGDEKSNDCLPKAFGSPRFRSQLHTEALLPALRSTLAAGDRNLDQEQTPAGVGLVSVLSIEIIGHDYFRLIEADAYHFDISAVQTLVSGDEIKAQLSATPWKADETLAAIRCTGI